MAKTGRINIAFFCDLGLTRSQQVHLAASNLASTDTGLKNRFTMFHAGTTDQTGFGSGTYEFEGPETTRRHLSQMDVIVPLSQDAQSIMRWRLELLEGQKKPRLVAMDEHGIDPDHIDPNAILKLLRNAVQKASGKRSGRKNKFT